MLSAFKNFLITFLVGALIFGVIGYFTTRYVYDIVTDILDGKKDVSGAVVNAPKETESKSDDPQIDPNLKVPDGKSFTMLIVGTDYRPDLYSDYYVSEEDFQGVIDRYVEEHKDEKTTADSTNNNADGKKESSKETAKDRSEPAKIKTGEESILKTDIRYIKATWIAVVRADKENREFAVCYLSPETHVTAPCGETTLGEAYGFYGVDILGQFVNAMIGIEIDYSFVLDGMTLETFVSSAGSIEFELLTDLHEGDEYHFSSLALAEEYVASKKKNEEEPAESGETTDTSASTETVAPETTAPVDGSSTATLEKGKQYVSNYSAHILNTFKEMSQDDVNVKSSYTFDMIEGYLKRFAGWSVEDLTEKVKELSVAEEGKEFDLMDPYSEKPVLATNFLYEDVEYIYSMLGAVEYFDYVEFVYPGSYSDTTKTFEPDIKAALEIFKKYRSSAEGQETSSAEQN